MKKEEADSLIRLRNLLSWELWSPDEIAECTVGLTSALRRRLWASLKEMPAPISSFECDDRVAYMESNAIFNVWNFFTPEEQSELGVHAEIHEDLREEAKVFSESWECGISEAEKLVTILALIQKGRLSKDASAEELADRNLTLETFADLEQFLTQWEMHLERESQELAELIDDLLHG